MASAIRPASPICCLLLLPPPRSESSPPPLPPPSLLVVAAHPGDTLTPRSSCTDSTLPLNASRNSLSCLGAIRIDAVGESHPYKPGEAWFESGPDPVYAAASPDGPTAFARVMVLPRTCLGKSSIRYVRPEDADRPKTQKYQIFADEFITP